VEIRFDVVQALLSNEELAAAAVHLNFRSCPYRSILG
jgi:hypothetical protein